MACLLGFLKIQIIHRHSHQSCWSMSTIWRADLLQNSCPSFFSWYLCGGLLFCNSQLKEGTKYTSQGNCFTKSKLAHQLLFQQQSKKKNSLPLCLCGKKAKKCNYPAMVHAPGCIHILPKQSLNSITPHLTSCQLGQEFLRSWRRT